MAHTSITFLHILFQISRFGRIFNKQHYLLVVHILQNTYAETSETEFLIFNGELV
jgi:hypothetical protein